jgi:hypothetical protein
MKGQTGIWIDGKKAIIVHLYDHTEVVDVLDADVEYRRRFEGEGKAFTRLGDHYISNEEREEERIRHERKHFFEDVIGKLDAGCDIAIFGPAQTKHDLLKAILGHHEFSMKPITLKPADEITVNQFVQLVHEYFGTVVA